MLRGMLIWHSGVILNLFFSGKVSVMECCVHLTHDKLRGMYMGFQQGLKVKCESKSIQGLFLQATHLSYASLSSLTLSSHLITTPAGVMATSFLPYAETLHFALNYGKDADVRRLWMPLSRTREHPNYKYIYQTEQGIKFFFFFFFCCLWHPN